MRRRITDENMLFPFAMVKTYKIAANDMCEASRVEFAEDFEHVIGIPPF